MCGHAVKESGSHSQANGSVDHYCVSWRQKGEETQEIKLKIHLCEF